MKVALLSAASSIHTIKWANGLISKGIDVYLLSQHKPLKELDKRVNLYMLPFEGNIGYFINVKAVKNILERIKPEIVNAHYASGYATTARLVNYKPWIISVWGSDVYDFPFKSILHRYLVTKNLLAASRIASTSYSMAEQVKKVLKRNVDIEITPFGVDIDRFGSISSPLKREHKETIKVGTIKAVSQVYGTDILLKAFRSVLDYLESNNSIFKNNLSLDIYGDGNEMDEMVKLAHKLGLEKYVTFYGRIDHENVPEVLKTFDIYIALSRIESFGVAIIEAGAAYRPVIVSNVGGLPEVVIDGVTGHVVEAESASSASEALIDLINNVDKRVSFGEAGFKHVQKEYDWNYCLDKMIDLYNKEILIYKR